MLEASLKSELVRNLEQLEGRVNHLYLDSESNITIGVGHLVANESAMIKLTLYRINANGKIEQLANDEEKLKEYSMFSKIKQPEDVSYNASYFKQYTRLRMKGVDINRLRDRHITSFYQELTRFYSQKRGYLDFDRFPRPAKLALFDLVFNLGATRFFNQYRKFNQAVKDQLWEKAAEESSRARIGTARNHYVKHLLLKAAMINHEQSQIPVQP